MTSGTEQLQAALARPQVAPRPGRRWRAVVATSAAAALAVVVAVVLLRPTSVPPVSPQVGASPAATPAIGGPTAGTPGSEAAAGQVLTGPPAGVAWELFQGVALPTSPTDGPLQADGPVHSGFTRTPTGALLAAAQIGVRRVVTPDLAGLQAVAEQQLVDGPGQNAFLNLLAGLRDNTAPAGGYAQYAGFQLVAFTPDLAVVSLATRSRRGVLQAETDTLRWTGGDWKLELPPSGLPQPQVLSSLAGYVPWSGLS